MTNNQIIAMGGGGFSMEPDNPLLDQYVIDCSGKSHPAVCFLPTAAAENPQYSVNFYQAFSRLGCRCGHLSLFVQPQRDLEAWLRQFDIIYVGGGNTRCMLALWREWGLDGILRRLWQEGVVMAGTTPRQKLALLMVVIRNGEGKRGRRAQRATMRATAVALCRQMARTAPAPMIATSASTSHVSGARGVSGSSSWSIHRLIDRQSFIIRAPQNQTMCAA